MKLTCCMCLKNFKEYGGILFSPPFEKKEEEYTRFFMKLADKMFGTSDDSLGGFVGKFHICPKCYRELQEFIQAKQEEVIK